MDKHWVVWSNFIILAFTHTSRTSLIFMIWFQLVRELKTSNIRIFWTLHDTKIYHRKHRIAHSFQYRPFSRIYNVTMMGLSPEILQVFKSFWRWADSENLIIQTDHVLCCESLDLERLATKYRQNNTSRLHGHLCSSRWLSRGTTKINFKICVFYLSRSRSTVSVLH